MNKTWLKQLASDIEARHGKEARDRIFGDIDTVGSDIPTKTAWFGNFTTGMDELDDKEFLQQMMAFRCPCGGDDEENGNVMKTFYNSSKTLEEFVASFGQWLYEKYDGDVDVMELRGNVLYMIKPWKDNASNHAKGCHCNLAMHTEKTVSDIFCYCCTIGHTGKMFRGAFGNEIKMDFIESYKRR
jgi:hypothetical protein